jgi:glucosamine--fructose-6-phosphate aminotransferase (isomerizing)
VGRPVSVVDAGELLLHGADGIGPGSLVVAASQTGLSRETVAVVQRLRARGVRVVGLVNEEASPLIDALGDVLSIGAGPESSNASKTFTATQLLAQLLAAEIAPAGGQASDFAAVPDAVARLLERPGLVDEPLAALSGVPYLVLLAHGPALSAARYGALLAREILALPADAVTISEFRHGPVELLAAGIGAIVMAPADGPGQDLAVGLATSIAQRGGRVWLIAPDRALTGVGPVTAVTSLGGLKDRGSAIVAAVALQRFVAACAPLLGRSPGCFTVFDPAIDTGRLEDPGVAVFRTRGPDAGGAPG